MINITFPDGAQKQFEQGITAIEIAKGISHGLAKKVLAAQFNNEVVEANRPLTTDGELKLLTWEDAAGKTTYWHSSAHLMAEAVQQLYPNAKFGIGPAIDKGFYYDIDFGDEKLSGDELPKIEKLMKKLAAAANDFKRSEVSKADAIAYFTEKQDPYKIELINDLEDGTITFYEQGGFTDLCLGPHLMNTNKIRAIKLLNVAGAYWKGDENNAMMTRIYGITFPQQEQLDQYMAMLEEAKKRDHRKLGAELKLFMFSERVGAGLPIWLPKGTALRTRLEDFLKQEQLKRGYQPVITPHIAKKELYVTSGHYEKYGEDTYRPIHTPKENEEFYLKPMNCPHHCEVYAHDLRSYRDLPLRIAEFGTVYRYEQSGELHGLTRVRSFTVDDAHIFCTQDQLKQEFIDVLNLIKMAIEKLGFTDFTAQISLRDPEDKEKYIGSEENWVRSEAMIIEAVNEVGLETVTELGEAAFYGPKLDFMIKDALGRQWQLGTVQVDYNLPERFGLEYIGSDGEKHRPIMIHRAPFGSMERFIGVLIEHTAGNFPIWLAPEQVRILPVAEKFTDYAEKIMHNLKKHDIRCSVDYNHERIGKLIRDAEVEKIPYMLIVGETEMNDNSVNVRRHGKGDIGTFDVYDFVEQFEKALQNNE